MLLMVLGEHVFCLCELRHYGPDNNCHGPKGRSGSLTRGSVDRKSRQTRSPDGHSGSLNRAPDGHSGSLNCGRSRPREGCCPRSTCRRSCGRSHSESRPTHCRQYQPCHGGKLFFVEKNNIFLTLIILLDRCHFPHCSGSRVPRVQKFIRDLATGTCHPIKMT